MKPTKALSFLIIGVLYMLLNSQGCSANPKYEKYSSKDPEIGVTMDYVAGWSAGESRGAYGVYAQVLFLEPVTAKKPLRASMVLLTQRQEKIEFKPADLKTMEEDFINKRLKLSEAKVLSRSKSEMLGLESYIFEFSYSLPDRPEGLNAKLIPVKERVIFFKRMDRFYVLRYVNLADEFSKFDKVFGRCVDTLRFKD